jgi:tetratricopeptide (TPR) repeat protein
MQDMRHERHAKSLAVLELVLVFGLAGAALARPDTEMARRRLQELAAECQGSPERAAELQAATSLLASRPIRPDALPSGEAGDLLRADALFLGVRPSEARQAYSQFLTRWARSPWTGYVRYQLAQLLERPEDAVLRGNMLCAVDLKARPQGLGTFALISMLQSKADEPPEKRLAALDAIAPGLNDAIAVQRLTVARGRLLGALGRYPEAWAAFGKAGAIPDEALAEAADAGFRAGQDLDRVGAMYDRIYKEALLSGKYDTRTALRKALLEERLGHFQPAADLHVRILTLRPRPPEADLALLRLALLVHGRKAKLPALAALAKLPADPLELLRQAASLPGEVGAQARMEYARALAAAGRMAESLALYKAIRGAPGAGPEAETEYKGLVLRALPDPNGPRAELLAYWSEHGEAFGAREKAATAEALRRAGLFVKAVELYREALEPPGQGRPLSAEQRRAVEAGLNGALAEGREQSVTASREPPIEIVRTASGDALLGRGLASEALQAYAKAGPADPAPELALKRAWCLLRLQRVAEARQLLAQAAGSATPSQARTEAQQLLSDLEMENRAADLVGEP